LQAKWNRMKNSHVQWDKEASSEPRMTFLQRHCFVVLVPIILSLSSALAAPGDPGEKPTAPFLAVIKEPATITRVFSGATEHNKKKPEESSPDQILRSITEIYDPVRRVQNFYAGKPNPIVFWVADGVMLGDHPTAPGSVYYDEGGAAGRGSDLVSVFPEANWVRLDNFAKWEKVEGQLCRVHQAVVPPTKTIHGDDNAFIISGPATAWIEEATRRPVKVQTEADLILFSYGPGPSSPLIVPPNFAKILKAIRYGPSGRMR